MTCTANISPAISNEDSIIQSAIEILETRIKQPHDYLTSPDNTRRFLKLKLFNLDREVFSVIFLDNQNGVIAYKELFAGTIDGAAVYPREVVKSALLHNAAAVIFGHNHPSGNSSPSEADKHITKRLTDACGLVDIRVLDHLVVGSDISSFAELGLL